MLKKPIINTLVQILGKALSVEISLITTGILTRKLGLNGYGSFVLISSLFVFLDSLADFGTKTIGVREVSKEGDEGVLEHIFNLRMIMATIAFGVGMVVVWQWRAIVEIRWEATVALLMIFLTSIGGFLEITFQSKLRMDLKVVTDLFFPLGFLGWLWLSRDGLSLMMIFTAYLVTRFLSLVVGYFLASSLNKIRFKKIETEKIVKLWKMTWPMGIFLMLFATYDRAIDTVLIQNYLGSTSVAWYGLAYKIYGVLLQPAYYYVNSIFPSLSAKSGGRRKLFGWSAVMMMVASIGLIGVTYVAAPMMISVLGGTDFEPAVMVLRILILAALFSYMGHLVGFTLISLGGQGEMLKIGLVAIGLNLFLNVLFIPTYGIMAAAWVTVFTEMIDCGMMIYFLKRKINLNIKT